MNYEDTIKEMGLTQGDMDKAKAQTPRPMLTSDESNVYFARSNIEGDGTFAMRDMANGARIAPLRNSGRWTLTGLLTNHSGEPNSRFSDGGDLFATKNISMHDEVTVDYGHIKEVLTGGTVSNCSSIT